MVVAVHVPGRDGKKQGGAPPPLEVSAEGGTLTVRRPGCPPVLARRLAWDVCTTTPPSVAVTADGRTAVIALAKAAADPPGGGRPQQPWRALFRGDSDGARAVDPPYRVSEEEGGGGKGAPRTVTLELSLPWWVAKEDVGVTCSAEGLTVGVAGAARVVRRFAVREGQAGAAVVPEETTWSLVSEERAAQPGARPGRLLCVVLTRPPPPEEDGAGAGGRQGTTRLPPPLFACDEDAFGLDGPLAGGVLAVGGVGRLRSGGGVATTRVLGRGDLPTGSAGVAVFDVLSGGVATPRARSPAAGLPRGDSDDDEEEDEDAWEFGA